ncbi:MAG: FxsA family protein [Proteobacteria bacterium]|nr:FxsA family protein [Pseudomonadota bacterium]
MDAFNSNPLVQSAIKKLSSILMVCFILEIAAFVGVSLLIGFGYAVLLTFIICLVGYSIAPSGRPGKPAPSMLTSPLKLVSTLLMIPGFLTDILAIILIIKPARIALMNFIIKKAVPREYAGMLGSNPVEKIAELSEQMKNLGGMGGMGGMNMNDFAAYAANMRSGAASETGRKAEKVRRASYAAADDPIDIDYEVKKSGAEFATIDVEHTIDLDCSAETSSSKKKARAAIAEDDVIDVPYEWHS